MSLLEYSISLIVAAILAGILSSRPYIWTMEHIACEACKTEYDLRTIEVIGWRLPPHKTVCEVCNSVLKDWEEDREYILIMTKRGSVREV